MKLSLNLSHPAWIPVEAAAKAVALAFVAALLQTAGTLAGPINWYAELGVFLGYLFVDVVFSTRWWRALPPDTQRALAGLAPQLIAAVVAELAARGPALPVVAVPAAVPQVAKAVEQAVAPVASVAAVTVPVTTAAVTLPAAAAGTQVAAAVTPAPAEPVVPSAVLVEPVPPAEPPR